MKEKKTYLIRDCKTPRKMEHVGIAHDTTVGLSVLLQLTRPGWPFFLY